MRLVVLAMVGCGFWAAAADGQTTPAASPAEHEVVAAIRARLDASARGDVEAWGRFVADECLCATSDKRALQAEMNARPPAVKSWYDQLSSFELRVLGDVVAVRYRATEHSEIGGQPIEIRMWRSETHVRRGGAWVLVAGADTLIPHDPPVAAVDHALYGTYTGTYEYAPGLRDLVTTDGDRLMVESTGQGKAELLPENETTFFVPGEDWRLVFVKDAQGRVATLRFRQQNQDVVARRIE